MRGVHLGALVGCALVACGCSSDPGVGGAGASGAGASAGDASGDASAGAPAVSGGSGGAAGHGNGGSSTSGAGGTTGNSKQGQIVFSELYSGGTTARPGLSASFSNGSGQGAAGECEVFEADGCKVTVCDGTPAVEPVASPSVGTITVTSPDVAGSGVLKPAADGTYGSPQIAFNAGFGGDEIMNFRAPGAEVPAIDEQLAMPLALLRSKPFVDNSTYHTVVLVPRSVDLELAWTRGAPDVVMLVSASSPRPDGKPGTAKLYCELPSVPGAAVVRSSLLERLNATASLRTMSIRTKTITAGPYNVRLATAFEVYDETKTFPVTDTIQLYDP